MSFILPYLDVFGTFHHGFAERFHKLFLYKSAVSFGWMETQHFLQFLWFVVHASSTFANSFDCCREVEIVGRLLWIPANVAPLCRVGEYQCYFVFVCWCFCGDVLWNFPRSIVIGERCIFQNDSFVISGTNESLLRHVESFVHYGQLKIKKSWNFKFWKRIWIKANLKIFNVCCCDMNKH